MWMYLTHCGLATPYGAKDLDNIGSANEPMLTYQQCMTSVSDNNLGAISQEIPQPSIPRISMTNPNLSFIQISEGLMS